MTLGFYLIHQAVFFTVARGMVNLTLNWKLGPANSGWIRERGPGCVVVLRAGQAETENLKRFWKLSSNSGPSAKMAREAECNHYGRMA